MNNNPKSNTKQYSTSRYSQRRARGRKHGQNKLLFFILLAVLILALIAAIVFVAIDLIGMNGSETTGGGDGEGTGGEQTPDGHPMSNAYDSNSETYMLSVTNQSEGSYFSCEFDEADVGEIKFSSTHSEYYIRRCRIELKIDGEWLEMWNYSYKNPLDETNFKPGNVTLRATGIRIVITQDCDALWAINEITVLDKNGYTVLLRAPSAGTNSDSAVTGDPSQGDITDPPEITTEPPVTDPPEPGYTTVEISNDLMYTGALILVNSQYAYRFPASGASLLTVYNEYVANDYKCNYFDDTSMQLEAVAAHNVLAMANALYTDTELNWLKLGTGYRSYETQQDLSTKYPATAALPGYSEHHTGLGVDLQVWDRTAGVTYNLDDPTQNCQKIYTWISANAYKYGFVRRFAPDKDMITGISSDRWHYRYVGVPHAYYMTANNLCLEEYLAALENCTYEGNHLMIDVDGKIYEVYYVAAENGTATTVPVPTDPTIYTVSGNNYSGFIVTVARN